MRLSKAQENVVCLQRLLRPVHDWAMAVLRRLPTDGTFDQEGPIRRLRALRRRNLYSFDLKSATDRWPLSVQVEMFESLFGNSGCLIDPRIKFFLRWTSFGSTRAGIMVRRWSGSRLLWIVDIVCFVAPYGLRPS